MGRGIENGRASCAVHPLPRTETRENGGSGAISIPRVGFIGFPNSPFDKKKKKKKFGSYSAPSTLFRESKKKKKKKTTQGSSHLSLWSEEKFDDRRGRFILLRTIYIYIFRSRIEGRELIVIIILTIDLRAKRYWGYERIYAYIFHQYRLIRSRTLHSRLDNCSSTYSI